MSIILPVAGDPLNAPSHSRLHRVVACDTASPDQSVTVNATGYLFVNQNQAYIGDGTTGADKYLYANTAGSNRPNLRFHVATSKWQFSNDGTTWADLGISTSYTTSFTSASIGSTGLLTVAHNLGVKVVSVTVYDNADKQIIPDEVTLINTNSLSVTLASYGTLSGTWNLRVVG